MTDQRAAAASHLHDRGPRPPPQGKVRKGEGWVARGVFEKGLVVKPHIPRMD